MLKGIFERKKGQQEEVTENCIMRFFMLRTIHQILLEDEDG
jgi:hypothetical protein